jgi:hypothetical protein
MLLSSAKEWINTIRGASEFRAARNRNAMAQPSDVLKTSSRAMGCIAVVLKQP